MTPSCSAVAMHAVRKILFSEALSFWIFIRAFSNAVFDCDVCDFRMERREQAYQVEEYASSHPSAQETNLFRNFSKLVLDGTPDPHWPKITLLTQKVMMACIESAENGNKEIEIT